MLGGVTGSKSQEDNPSGFRMALSPKGMAVVKLLVAFTTPIVGGTLLINWLMPDPKEAGYDGTRAKFQNRSLEIELKRVKGS